MITRIENEIIELHQFFQDWYNNQLTPTKENFARCADVLAPDIQVLHQLGELILATYEEWQKIEGKVTTRISSVLFQNSNITPNGLLWFHVHETWINN
jgi:hypothetical protein